MSATEEFWGTDPKRIVEDLYNLNDDAAADLVTELEKSMVEVNRSALCDAILDELRKSLDVNMDKLEVYCLKNVFDVPKGLDLKEEGDDDDDQTSDEDAAELEEAKLDAKIIELETKTKILDSQLGDAKAARDLLRRTLDEFSSVAEAAADAASKQTPKTDTEEFLKNYVVLRSLCEKGEKLEKVLNETASSVSTNSSSMRRLNQAYARANAAHRGTIPALSAAEKRLKISR